MQIWQIGNIQIQMYLNQPDLKIIQERNDTTQQFSLNKHKSVYFSFSLFLKSCKCFSLRKKRLQGAVFMREENSMEVAKNIIKIKMPIIFSITNTRLPQMLMQSKLYILVMESCKAKIRPILNRFIATRSIMLKYY